MQRKGCFLSNGLPLDASGKKKGQKAGRRGVSATALPLEVAAAHCCCQRPSADLQQWTTSMIFWLFFCITSFLGLTKQGAGGLAESSTLPLPSHPRPTVLHRRHGHESRSHVL